MEQTKLKLIGEMILEMYRSGVCLFSVRSPGGVAELYCGDARKVEVDGASLTIEREAGLAIPHSVESSVAYD